MLNFYTPWKCQKPFGFKGVKKYKTELEWVKEQWLLDDSEKKLTLEKEFQ